MVKLKNKLMVLLLINVVALLTSYGQKEGYPVMFAIDGVQQQLNNDFKIYFIYTDSVQTVCYQPIVFDSNYISFPLQMPKDTNIKYHVLFVYKNKAYYCDYNDYRLFTNMCGRAFLIHFERPPFNKFVHWGKYSYNTWISNATYNDIVGRIKIVYGLGDSPATYTEIYSFKSYFKKGKEILKKANYKL